MDNQEIFENEVRSGDDLAGVFEHDGETGYFYLYDMTKPEGQKVVAAVHVMSGPADFLQEEVSIQWEQREEFVGLFIKGTLWAAFEAEELRSFDGGYGREQGSEIPAYICDLFDANPGNGVTEQ